MSGGDIVKKLIVSVFMFGLLTFGSLPIAQMSAQEDVNERTVTNVGGGTWDYGRNSTVWSKYYHANNRHSSTVEERENGARNTKYANAKLWSDAWWVANPTKHYNSYYNNNA